MVHCHKVFFVGLDSHQYEEYYPHQKIFVSLDPEGFRIFWIQKVFVSLDTEGFRILYLPANISSLKIEESISIFNNLRSMMYRR